MDGKVVMTGDWFRKLAERVGIGERDENMPAWALEDGRFSPESGDSEADYSSLADIPPALKRRVQAEAVHKTFHRLETPLRFLLYATVPGQEPQSLEECHDILNLWRQGLEKEARLVPDAYAGAVTRYEPGFEEAYYIHGRCGAGDTVRITVPAWRIQGDVVVRGEAEPVPPGEGGTPHSGGTPPFDAKAASNGGTPYPTMQERHRVGAPIREGGDETQSTPLLEAEAEALRPAGSAGEPPAMFDVARPHGEPVARP